MTKTPQDISFEVALEQLQEQVRRLEAGELPLQESITAFETGMKLAMQCEQRLAEAKGKVEILLKQSDGGVMSEPFTVDA